MRLISRAAQYQSLEVILIKHGWPIAILGAPCVPRRTASITRRAPYS